MKLAKMMLSNDKIVREQIMQHIKELNLKSITT